MDKKFYAILVVLIIIGAFYWYMYRPSEISQSCEKNAEVLVLSDGSSVQITNSNLVNFKYQECLRQNGIINTNVSSQYTPSQDTIPSSSMFPTATYSPTIQPAP